MKSYQEALQLLRSPRSDHDRRHRQIALAAATSGVSRISALLLAYLSVSLAVNKLGPVNFGLWMAVNSLAVLLPFADFGLGNGLITVVSRKIGEKRLESIPSMVASCLYLTLAAGALMAAAGVGVSKSGLLVRAFSPHSHESLTQMPAAAAVFFICLGITLPLTLVEKVQMAAQDAHVTSGWQIAANLTTCATVFIASKGEANLYSFVLAYSGTPILVKAANSISYFAKHPEFAPSLKTADWAAGRSLMKFGASFVLLQSSVAIGYSCDNLILASQAGPIAVATYDVVQRLFSLTIVTELSIAPLWGAFGEAMGRGDVEWVRRTFYRSIRLNGILCAALCVGLVATGKILVDLWTRGRINPDLGLLLAFAAWRLLNVLQGNLSVLLNHEATLKDQTKYFVGAALASFALKVPLLRLIGPPGVVVATVITFATIYCVPGMRMANRILKGRFGPIGAQQAAA